MVGSLSELAERTGEKVETLEYYETIGLIQATAAASPRMYGEDALLRVLIIQKGKRLGLSLSDIGALMSARSLEYQRKQLVDAKTPNLDL